MDPQIEELKQLIRQNIAITTETNKIVRSMRNASRLKSALWATVAGVSIIVSIYSYYYYVAPRVAEIKTFYQENIVPLRENGGISEFIQKMFAQQASVSQKSTQPTQ